jgi:hypothetical protein
MSNQKPFGGILCGDVLFYYCQFSNVNVSFTANYPAVTVVNGLYTQVINGRSSRGADVIVPVGKVLRKE